MQHESWIDPLLIRCKFCYGNITFCRGELDEAALLLGLCLGLPELLCSHISIYFYYNPPLQCWVAHLLCVFAYSCFCKVKKVNLCAEAFSGLEGLTIKLQLSLREMKPKSIKHLSPSPHTHTCENPLHDPLLETALSCTKLAISLSLPQNLWQLTVFVFTWLKLPATSTAGLWSHTT